MVAWCEGKGSADCFERYNPEKLQNVSLGQLAVLKSPGEIFKVTIHRDPVSIGLGWILGIYIYKSLVGNSGCLHFSKRGMSSHLEFHVDNTLKRLSLELVFLFCFVFGVRLFVCLLIKKLVLFCISLGLLKPFFSLESNQVFYPGKILLFVHVFIH